ncbi:MAG: T9SS type A sorting domain-containing protein [Saprospiraceae bacterium]|nr:T9SS type A sorting domain-containing protein [Saprospiraceae bacterium]
MKIFYLSLTLLFFSINLWSQPLFRVNHSYQQNPDQFTVPCGTALSVTPLIPNTFNSYLWNFGDGISSTAYAPQAVNYSSTGLKQVSLTVTNSVPFTVINSITVTQTNNNWEEETCGNTPDFYLKIYDTDNNQLFETPAVGSTYVPVTYQIAGIVNKVAFVVKVWESDHTFFCPADDFVGEVTIPANATAMVYQNAAQQLSIQINTTTSTIATFTVPVNLAGLNVSINSNGSTILCHQGDSRTLTATAGFDTYLWSSGQTTSSITINQAGTYTVTATKTSTGCTGVDNISISQAPAQAKPVIDCAGTLLVCTNYSSSLKWLDSNQNGISGAWSQTYQPTSNGIYYVKHTSGGCDVISDGINYPACTSVTAIEEEESSNNLSYSIYPNPSSTGIFEIKLLQEINNPEISYEIYTLRGQLIREKTNHTRFVDLTDQPAGMYIIKTRINDKLWIDRIVKN